jgi:hypothetical protein
MVSSDRRTYLLWFCAGLSAPLVLWGLSALSQLLHLSSAQSVFELLALGSCPFWLFLWIPAMLHPASDVLFFVVSALVLVANGCLYLVMARLQTSTLQWNSSARRITLIVAYPILMALGYCAPLGLEALMSLRDGPLT